MKKKSQPMKRKIGTNITILSTSDSVFGASDVHFINNFLISALIVAATL